MRAVRELEQLSIGGHSGFVELLHFCRDADRKAARVEAADRRYATASLEQRAPGCGCVIAGRGDETKSRDRDPPLTVHRSPSCAATSILPIATCLPFTNALVLAIMTPLSSGDVKSTRNSTLSPGAMKERSFIFGTRVALTRAPADQ